VPDLETHIDNLAVQLEAWSLVSLKEWRQKQQDEDTMEDVVVSTSSISTTRQRQKNAMRKLMRTLRQKHEETMQEDDRENECHDGMVASER
jgi:hypothetical protein